MKRVLTGTIIASALVFGASITDAQAQRNRIRTGATSNTNAAGERATTGAAADRNHNANVRAEQTSAVDNSNSPTTSPAPSGATDTTNTGNVTRPATTPTTTSNTTPATNTTNVPLTSLYRVGVGDVLDIRLLNVQTRQSTLYTIMAGGLLEYPLVGDPLTVAGSTTDEIAARLTEELRRRQVFAAPQVSVAVRDYVSHTVTVSGLVGNAGTRVIRREAVPLYVVLAESQPRPEAGRATITRRASGENLTIDLTDTTAMNTLVQSGDVIAVQGRLPQFFYIGGQVGAPGQKDFHAGMTLTQAILASGGATRFAGGRARVSRQAADGRLVSTEYNLRDIEQGRTPDPQIQPGDRIELGRSRW